MIMVIKLGIILLAFSGATSCPDTPDCASCARASSFNYCFWCIDSVWDENERVCQPIEKSQLIPDCDKYSLYAHILTCTDCNVGFYLSDGSSKCRPFDDPLCAAGYDNICEYCLDQHVLNSETNRCEQQQHCECENCSICDNKYSQCVVCKQGYARYRPDRGAPLICEKSVDNCLEAFNNNNQTVCIICMPGYYITSKATCEKVPGYRKISAALVGSLAPRSLLGTRSRETQV